MYPWFRTRYEQLQAFDHPPLAPPSRDGNSGNEKSPRLREGFSKHKRSGLRLLDVDLSAGLFDCLLDLVGLVLADGLLDGLWRAIDEVLGFFEAETRDFANGFDDVQL